MSLMRRFFLWGSRSRWLESQLQRRAFAQRAVRRFLPGERLEDALEAAARLGRDGLGAVLTQLGENVDSREQAEQVAAHYLEVLERVKQRGLVAEPSVKLTQLGLDVGRELCEELLGRVVARAAALGGFVWVDMEGSAYTDVTLAVYQAARARHQNVGVCVQAYLYRTPADLEKLLAAGGSVRLVKGAYAEPPEVAMPRKRDVDAAYLRLAQLMLGDRRGPSSRLVFGTHDMKLVSAIRERAAAAGLPRGTFEIHMLYGIRSAEQQRLAGEGVPVRVLISYGGAWFPWYMRRLAERPANAWFVMRSLMG
jgi:proline dehydrogenase